MKAEKNDKISFRIQTNHRLSSPITHHCPPISIVISLNSSKACHKLYNALQHSDVGDGDQLLPYVEDCLQQWRCLIIPAAEIILKVTSVLEVTSVLSSDTC